ncbi:MAG: molybdopterin-guanine dinucleotide biosynthesis protein B [Thermoplasmata archaeon]|nr:MAG: molybdopterin-guanine dinucleotide biosynthesis protein B [Thermoplasmata archaeon]
MYVIKNTVILGVYGTSNSGKTTLIIDLVYWLTSKGFKVATVKKTNKAIQLDATGKDTFLHGKAGASITVFSSEIETTGIIQKRKSEIEIIDHLKKLDEYDVILIEGSNAKNVSKIRMDPQCQLRENTIFTYDKDNQKIKKYLINVLNMRKKEMNYKTTLKVNGKKVGLSEFPDEFIQNTILGMISSLKGVDSVETLSISLDIIEKKE